MTFSIFDIPEDKARAMIDSGVWSRNCPVKMQDLRLLELLYCDFDGAERQGELVVHHAIADDVIIIFRDLYHQQFPIQQMVTMDQFHGSDDESMRANNSSCFNNRMIKGTDKYSLHSYGLAIDINPVQNPCISFDKQGGALGGALGGACIEPARGQEFVSRNNQRPGMVEPVVDIFKKNGFEIWGGQWNDPVDYHHFQVSRDKLEHVLNLA